MKEQYVGDINDFRKYNLLRTIVQAGRIKLGVCWMLTDADGRSEGNNKRYLQYPERWRSYDPILFDLLRSVVANVKMGDRLAAIEKSGVLANALFQNDPIPDDLRKRQIYMNSTWRQFEDRDLIFFDPDIGIEVPSKAKGRKFSSKYLYWDEIGTTYLYGHSLLVYQHFGREDRNRFVSRLIEEFNKTVSPHSLYALSTPHALLILALQCKHSQIYRWLVERKTSLWNVGSHSSRALSQQGAS